MQLITNINQLKVGDKIYIKNHMSIDDNKIFTIKKSSDRFNLVTEEDGGWILNLLIKNKKANIYLISIRKSHFPKWW